MNEQTRKYRIRDWRAHNAALVERGSLTVWFDENAVARWYETKRTGRRGAPRRYSDIAVQCGLVPGYVTQSDGQDVYAVSNSSWSTMMDRVDAGQAPAEAQQAFMEDLRSVFV